MLDFYFYLLLWYSFDVFAFIAVVSKSIQMYLMHSLQPLKPFWWAQIEENEACVLNSSEKVRPNFSVGLIAAQENIYISKVQYMRFWKKILNEHREAEESYASKIQ